MKSDIFPYVVIGLLFFVLIFLFVYGYRLFSQKTTPIDVFSPAEGVSCVRMVTADGAAVDCWRD